MRTPTAPVLLALVILSLVGGCSDDSAGNAEPPSRQAPSAPEDPSPSRATPAGTPDAGGSPEPSASPFAADTRPDDGGHGSGNGLGLTGVRTAGHPGFDRVVFDLDGKGKPGWRVEYTTDPRAEGSGDRVELEGTEFLQVVLRGVGLPVDTGVAAYGDSTTRVPATGTRGVTEVAPGGVFEGEQQAFIGLTGTRRPFRAFALTDPARVVVDVRTG